MLSENKSTTKNEVQILIDLKPYHSPNPTTGHGLYQLGNIATGLILFRDAPGEEDIPIVNGPEFFHLKDGEHFHTGEHQSYTIYVNGQGRTVTTKWVTFKEIVALAFPNPPTGANILFTVGYEDGPHANPEGSLMPAGKVKVQNGMIFNVTATDKS